MKKLRLSYVGSGLFAIIAIAIMALQPFSANLADSAHMMLGGVFITLGIWIFKPFDLPYAVGGMFMAAFALTLGLTPTVVFSGFTQPAIWTLVPALFFGFTLQKTGLGRRIALGIIKLSKPSYISLVFAWVVIGLILSALTPSITVRVAIVMPIAVQCCELCKIAKGSKGNSLILLTAFAMALLPGSGWLSGSLWGPVISGMINAAVGNHELVTFDSWFSVLFLPMMLTTVLVIAGSLFMLKPKDSLSKDAIDEIKKQPVEKMRSPEAITVVVLLAVFLMLLTGRFHGLPDAAVCLTAVFALFLFGVLKPGDFNSGINWDLVVFFSMTYSLGAIFNETGLSAWLAGIVVPALAPIAGNPWLFLFGIVVFMFIWRFFDAALLVPTIAIMTPMLPAIQEAYGISPLLLVPIFVMAANCFFMVYQNMWAMLSRSIAGDRAWANKHLGAYGVLYFVACLIALVVAIPMWINAGLFT